MSVREYIGARYVPIFADPVIWDNVRTYEPLTIVQYQGNSYTSKQFVPSGIDINNETYWAITGNYNAQIEQYRQEVTAVTVDLNEFKDMPVITVEQYGAIGDGVTDCTSAIQQAIAENPNKIIAFKGGTYIISNSIHCWGNLGGQEIDLGGSYIVNNNNTVASFIIDGTYQLAEGDYLYPYIATANPVEGKCYIHGGTLKKGLAGIISLAYHTVVQSVKIMSPATAGLIVGSETSQISQQGMFSDILVMRSTSDPYWSEEALPAYDQNTIPQPLPLETMPCGIIVNDPDNIFNNINVNRFSVCMRIRSGGQLVTNAHLTIQPKYALPFIPHTASVVFDPFTNTSWYYSKFSNIYFDNSKYCFYAPVAHRQTIMVDNSFYFNSGNSIQDSVVANAYMAKNIYYLEVSEFGVISATKRVGFIPACALLRDYQIQGLVREQYNKNIYTMGNTENPYQATMLVNDGESVLVIRPANTVNEGVKQCVGCLFIPGTATGRFNSVDINVYDRSYLTYKGTIESNGTTITINDTYCRGSSRDRYKIEFGDFTSVVEDGIESNIVPIYVTPNRTISSTPIYISLDTHNAYVQGFLNPYSLLEYTPNTVIASIDFSNIV